ncbi:MAG: gamma-glutamyltransferase family protein [Nocardioides sp.]|uniref:gamma-glutamyltransferase family protein n=1 Tax=Nocardioides sp. TaxID=35761 RepID=UPI0039E64B51
MSGFTTRPEIVGTLGAVAATHWLAAQSGMAVLEAGGNAFDATVAAGFVLHVVEPHQNGLGGDAVLLCHHAGSDKTFVLCGQGPAPDAATTDAFINLGLAMVPGVGQLPAVVPGAFGAWLDLLARYGTMRLDQVMQFALTYAEDGYPLPANAVEVIATVASVFSEHWTDSAALYLPNGEVPKPNARFRNPSLARTLRRLLGEARAAGHQREAQIEAAKAAFYKGFVAEEIDAFTRHVPVWDGSGEPHTGLLAYDDLARWQPSEEEPVRLDFRGFTVCKTGPWGQGPVLLQQLALLDGYDLDDTTPGSAELVHTVVECAKLAFADRDAFYGDPRYADVPLDALLSRTYADQRRVLVGPNAAAERCPGTPGGRPGRLPYQSDADAAATNLQSLVPSDRIRSDTCHVDVVDRFGNLVSATTSGGWLQSTPIMPTLGFGLPTRAQMFDLHGGPNALQPGKRPRTTLSPGLLIRDGSPYLAFGTPGGDQQDQWPLIFLLNHVVYGMGLQESLDAPVWHTTHLSSSFHPRTVEPRGLHVESRLGGSSLAELRRRGHNLAVEGPWGNNRTSAAGPADDGLVRAAASPRSMQGYAVGR